MLELWRMQSTPLLLSFPDPLWPRVVAFDRVLSIGQKEITELFVIEPIIDIKMDLHLNNL